MPKFHSRIRGMRRTGPVVRTTPMGWLGSANGIVGEKPADINWPGGGTLHVGQAPSAGQCILAGFSPTIPFADPSHPIGVVRTTGPVRRMPRILEWNLGIQHEFSQNWVAQIGYVGTRAYHLWNHEVSDLNQPLQPLDSNFSDATGNFGRPYFNVLPDLSNILPLDFPQLQMTYNAFQA